MGGPEQVVWEPQPRQSRFITCPADDVGFGGARGGGKSDAVIGDWLSHEDLCGSDAKGMAFRRERVQLVDLIERAKQVLAPMGHKWLDQEKTFRGPNGGRLRFSYLERDADADAYQGHSYTRLYGEEIGTFPAEGPIQKLTATLRSGAGVQCQLKTTCNPGGVGHQWVKARYRLGEYPQGNEIFRYEFAHPLTGEKIEKTRVFIPSRVYDNQYLGADYVATLSQVGSPALVRAWLDGDWSVIEGAYFSEWMPGKHICEPFEIPSHWLRYRAMDWGSAAPFAVLWFAVASEDTPLSNGCILPRGGLVVCQEWYGCEGVNKGLRLHADAVGVGIRDRERVAQAFGVLDPSAFRQDGGPSIAEVLATNGATFRPADNTRLAGWSQVRGRLRGLGDDRPMLVVFKTATHTIRTLPALQHDKTKPEDVDTDAEDHAPDALRYGCMARPWAAQTPVERDAVPKAKETTMDDLIRMASKKRSSYV